MTNKQEQMSQLLEEQKRSGLSVRKFCEERGIKYATFNYWARKARQAASGSFLPVRLLDSGGSGSSPVELVYPNGVKLRLGRFDFDQIRQLVKLGRC